MLRHHIGTYRLRAAIARGLCVCLGAAFLISVGLLRPAWGAPRPFAIHPIVDTDTATPSLTPSSTATDTPPPGCPLGVTLYPATIEQGGSLDIQFNSMVGATIDAQILTGASYPSAAMLFPDATGDPGTAISASTVVGGFQYTFAVGSAGTALLSVPIPAGASPGQVPVQVTATCNLEQSSQQLTFTVVPEQPIPFTGHLLLGTHDLLIRSVELPPNAGSIVHNPVSITTDASDLVTLAATIVSNSAGSLGTADDGGTAYASGATFYTALTTADTGGSAQLTLPVNSALLRPGKGAVVRLAVTCATGSRATVYRTSFPIREKLLRLIVQPAATTRGGTRQLLLLRRQPGGSSQLTIITIADKGAHLAGTFITNGVTVPAANQPVTAGAGGRATLRFSIPNDLAPPSGTHGMGVLSITSTFRGAQISRGLSVSYGSH